MHTQKRIDDGIKKAALYARVSTEEQAMHGVSLDAQKERLIQYAKENGLQIVGVYVDEGISARKRYTRRPEFMRMIKDVQQKKIDVVLFIKLDRWFRNIADYYEVQAILDRNHVEWIATEEEYDTTTANGRLALNIKLAIAQDESDRTSERIKFVFQNMVKEGRVISGMCPLGYKIAEKKLVIDEENSDLIKEMFEKYLDVRSINETRRYISSKYGRFIDAKSMRRMLTNRVYTGEAYGIKNWCPAIIDEKTMNIVSELVSVRSQRYSKTRTDRVYLFTGLVFCGCCGRRMVTYACRNTEHGNVFIYYRCPVHSTLQCQMKLQINQNKIEKWLLENLKAEAERHNIEIDSRKKALPKKAIDTGKVTAKIEKLKDLYINDLLPKEIYERDYKELIRILEEANRQKAELEEQKFDLSSFDSLLDAYVNLDQLSKKAFWSRVLKSLIVKETGEFVVSINQL